MDEKQKSAILHTEWMGFSSNIGALYTFFENLSETADKLDRDKKRELATNIAPILKEDPEKIEKEFSEFMPSIDDLDVYPDIRENEAIKEAIDLFQDNEFKEQLLSWENKHPHKSHKLAKNLFSLFSNPPMTGLILRKSMLITLVTFLEVLIEALFINQFLIQGSTRPEAAKEAEKIMRGKGGWNKRLSNLEQLGISTRVSSLYRTEILEIVNLRNLFVHNDGVIDKEYLDHPLQDYKGKLEPGKILIVSTKRLQRSLNIVWVYGLILCQSHWRFHETTEKLQNDKIDQFFIDSFDKKRYGLILELSEKIEVLELTNNISQRVLVDRAIALRELSRTEEVKFIVSKLQSSSHDWQIDLAISMLNNDYKTLQRQLADAKSKYDIRKLVYWPLFEPIKNEIWFKIASTQNRQKVNLPNKRR